MSKPTFYRNCIMPERSHHGLFTAYVQYAPSDGSFVHASTLSGLRGAITNTLAAHGRKSALR